MNADCIRPVKPKWLIIAGNIYGNVLAKCRLLCGQVESQVGATHWGWPVERSVAYIHQVFGDYLAYGNLTPEWLRGKRILEIGPGDNLGVALRCLAAGASHVVCLDKYFAKRNVEQQTHIYQALRSGLSPEERSRYDEAVYLDGSIRFNPQMLTYISGVPVEKAHRVVDADSIDLVLSRAVIWEIHNIDFAFAAMHQILRKGGRMVHKVACLDWMFTQNGYHPLEFLTVSDRIYNLMASDSGKCNRRTRAYYRNTMAALGYDATCHITRTIGHRGPEFPPNTTAVIAGTHYTDKTVDTIRQIRPRLLPRYRQLPDEELMVEDMFLVATKPLVNGGEERNGHG